MHSSASVAADLMALRSFCSAARLPALSVARYSSTVRGFTFAPVFLKGSSDLFGSSAEPSGEHLNPQQCAAACDIQGSFVTTSECQALTPARNAPDGDDSEMLTTRAHYLDARFGERIQAAFFIDDETVGAGEWRVVRRGRLSAAHVAGEHAAIRQPAIRKNVERVRVDTARVVDV